MLYHAAVFAMIAVLGISVCLGGPLLASVGVNFLLTVFVAMAVMSCVSDLVVGALAPTQDRQPQPSRS